ncbi:hypothetical protein [Tolypothrix sp. VBCCA 56010]|uniref:hypothetical protein n=1 Tax=Tolypothrix sp. VBCCA 56010 TaxID=3137731 RepID=UPI003D7CFF35
MTTNTLQPDDGRPMSPEEFRAKYLRQGGGAAGISSPVVDAARMLAGQSAQAGGEAFEKHLALLHGFYATKLYAFIDRLPVPTAPAPRRWGAADRNGPPLLMRTARQLSDFAGVVGCRIAALVPAARGSMIGRAVYMEAKASKETDKRLPIRGEQQEGFGLKAHQLLGLMARAQQARALAAVVWRNGPKDVLVLPTTEVVRFGRGFVAGKEKSIPMAAFLPVPADGGWLESVVVDAVIQEVGK